MELIHNIASIIIVITALVSAFFSLKYLAYGLILRDFGTLMKGVVGVITTLLLIYSFIGTVNMALISECEIDLPRNESCTLVAIKVGE